MLSSQNPRKQNKYCGDILPLYGPDSGMPSVVETHDSERFCGPGTLG